MNSNEEIMGILVIKKEQGMTSHDVVNKVRRLYHTKQVGHTGTLDPMATGVLPIMVGRAVKASEYLVSEDKIYKATLQLGMETDTEDITGTVLRTCDILPKKEEVLSAIPHFVGKVLQTPPMYSALKVNGKKLCDLARQNITVERKQREITVFSIETEILNEEKGLYSLLVHCSKGTYIRTLLADIGKFLKVGGVMASLERLKSGAFEIGNAVTLGELEEKTDEEKEALLLPVERLFESLPVLKLVPFYARLASSGCEIYEEKIHVSFEEGAFVRLYREKEGFFALGQVKKYEKGLAIKCIKQFVLQSNDHSPRKDS